MPKKAWKFQHSLLNSRHGALGGAQRHFANSHALLCNPLGRGVLSSLTFNLDLKNLKVASACPWVTEKPHSCLIVFAVAVKILVSPD